MLWTIFLVLVVLWMLGVVSSYTLGGFIHVLLVLAIVALLVQLIQGRRVVCSSRSGKGDWCGSTNAAFESACRCGDRCRFRLSVPDSEGSPASRQRRTLARRRHSRPPSPTQRGRQSARSRRRRPPLVQRGVRGDSVCVWSLKRESLGETNHITDGAKRVTRDL